MSDHGEAKGPWVALTAVFAVAAVATSVTGVVIDVYFVAKPPQSRCLPPADAFAIGLLVSLFLCFLATVSFAVGTAIAPPRRVCRTRFVRFLAAAVMGPLLVAGIVAIGGLLPSGSFPAPLLCILLYAVFVPGLIAYRLIGHMPKEPEKAAFPAIEAGRTRAGDVRETMR